MSSENKFSLQEAINNPNNVVDFFEKAGLDASDFFNVAKKIKVPFWSIATSVLLFIVVSIATSFTDDANIVKALAIVDIFLATLVTALVYMCWKNKTLAFIVVFGEFLILSVALDVYTPKEAVKKAGEKIESVTSSTN